MNKRPAHFSHVILLAPLLLLAGCGGNYTQQITKVTGTTKYLDPSKATQTYQGFSHFSIDEQGVLHLRVLDRLYAPELEAPLLTTKQIEGQRANPVGSALATGLTFGLYPLFLPKEFIRGTIGHQTSEQVLNVQPDTTRARLTGRQEWVAVPYQKARVEVRIGSNLNPPIVLHANSEGHIRHDLSQSLFQASQQQASPISIEFLCSNCRSNAQRPTLSFSNQLTYRPPPSWRVLAEYQNSRDILWVGDQRLFPPPSASKRQGATRIVSWGDFSNQYSVQANTLLRSRQELPAELRRERADLLRNKPSGQVTLTRDEFETTAAFNERARQAKVNEQRRIDDYNRRVSLLNQRIQSHQRQAPATLSKNDSMELMSHLMRSLLGEPEVKTVAYDADLQQFFITVGGSSQPTRSAIQFSLVTRDKVSPSVARSLRDEILKARTMIRLDLVDQNLKPSAAHLILPNQTALRMQFIDGFESPPLQTVRLDATERMTVEAIQTPRSPNNHPPIALTEDPESQQLRLRLESLRSNLQQRQQVTAERERLTSEIRDLESRLKRIDEGDFSDDLEVKIKSIKITPARSNVHAIIIGISSYSELPRVIFADRSARSFSEAIKRRFGIPNDQIVTMINEEATGTRLLARIRSIANKMGPNDQLIVYFAGHGAPTPDGRQTVLIPYDATVEVPINPELNLQAIYRILNAGKAQHTWVVLDACFSGRTDNNELIYRDVAPIIVTPRGGLTPLNSERLTVLAAGEANDFANAKRSSGHRLFTYHLIDQLSKSVTITPSGFNNIASRVTADAVNLGPVYRQRPQWIGHQSPFLPPQAVRRNSETGF